MRVWPLQARGWAWLPSILLTEWGGLCLHVMERPSLPTPVGDAFLPHILLEHAFAHLCVPPSPTKVL